MAVLLLKPKRAKPFRIVPRAHGFAPRFFLPEPFVSLLAAWILAAASFCLADVSWALDQNLSDGARQAEPLAPSEAPRPGAGIPEAGADAKPEPERVRSIYSNATPQEKAYLRAGLESALFFGIAEGYYLSDQTPDEWDEYHSLGAGLRARFITGDAYRFDHNPWSINVAHVADGSSFYLLSRTNGLSLPESLLATTGISTAWELFGEYPEEFSINDAVFTPVGGFATGEVIYQLGEFFQHSSCTIPNRALGYLFGPSAAFHRWLDGTQPTAPDNVDKFGFTTDAWHRFRLSAGGGGSSGSGEQRAEEQVGFDFEVVTAEKYGKPGEVCLFYCGEGLFNDLSINFALADGEVVDLRFLAQTAFLGRYQQNIVADKASGNLEGYSLFLGLSSAFEYYGHDFSGLAREDSLAICDLVGPTVITDYYHQGLHLRTSGGVFPTLSMVHPAAGELYDQAHGTKDARFVYRLHGYYYALGMGAMGKAEIDYGPFDLEAQIRYNLFDSVEGFDFVWRTADDNSFADERLSLQASLYCKLSGDNWKMALDAEKLYRWSSIADFSHNEDETRYLARVVFQF